MKPNVKTEQWADVSDDALIEALKHPSLSLLGRGGRPCKPWLYASADGWDSRKADFSRWFVTGPRDRRGYIKGPFRFEQVKRVVSAARLAVVCHEGGRPIAYEVPDEDDNVTARREALRAQLRHLTLPSQRAYRRKIERELAAADAS